jgi:uncharacterized protein YecT (DUF1311 family)
MKTFLPLLLAWLAGPLAALAQPGVATTKPGYLHPIEATFETCLSQKTNDLERAECEMDRYRRWSDLLDQRYDELMAHLRTEEQKMLFEDQQVAWAEYRQHVLVLSQQLQADRGAAGLLAVARLKTELVRHRLTELENYLKLVAKPQPNGGQNPGY